MQIDNPLNLSKQEIYQENNKVPQPRLQRRRFSKIPGKLLFFVMFTFLLNVIESIALLARNIESRKFRYEPLRMITSAALFMLISTYWILDKKFGNRRLRRLKLEISYVIVTLFYVIINCYFTSSYNHEIQILAELQYADSFKCMLFGISLYFYSFHPLTRFFLLFFPYTCSFVVYQFYNVQFAGHSICFGVLLLAFGFHYGELNNVQENASLQGGVGGLSQKETMDPTTPHRLIQMLKQEDKPPELLNLLPDGIVILNQEKEIVYVNDSLSTLLNCSKQEVASKFLSLPNKDYFEDDPKKSIILPKRSSTEQFFSSTMSPEEARLTKAIVEVKTPQFSTRNLNEPELNFSNLNVKSMNKLKWKSFNQLPDEEINTPKNEKESPLSKGQKWNEANKNESPSLLNISIKNKTVIERPIININHVSISESKLKPKGPIDADCLNITTSRLLLNPNSPTMQNCDIFSPKNQKIDQDMWVTAHEYNRLKSTERIAEQQATNYRNRIDQVFENFFNKTRVSKKKNVKETIMMLMDKLLPILQPYKDIQSPDGSSIRIGLKHSVTAPHDEDFLITQDLTCGTSHSLTMNSLIKVSDKRAVLFEIKFCPVILGGQLNIVCVVRDNTDKDVAMRLKEVDRQKNASLASITHDFRSPLNGILSMLETLKLHTSPELQENYLDPAFASAKSLLNMVNDILDLYQIRAKQLRLVFVPCVLQEVLKNCLDIIKFPAKMKGLKLQLDIKENVSRTIHTDPNRLQQIIVNLLSNSLKFTQKGSISLTASQESTGKIKISVQDTGVGIKTNDLPNLFKQFGKLDLGEDNTLNPQGIGLGLSISHGLARRLSLTPDEGGLKVFSNFGEGTEFWFVIDDMSVLGTTSSKREIDSNKFSRKAYGYNSQSSRGWNRGKSLFYEENSTIRDTIDIEDFTEFQAENTPIAFPKSHFLLSASRENNCDCAKILITDDDGFQIWALQSLLKNLGIKTPDTAFSGDEAVKKNEDRLLKKTGCSCSRYSLIFMDCEMPGMNGMEATSEINLMFQQAHKAPPIIIGVTGYSSQEHIDMCIAAGMARVLTKPIQQNELEVLLREYGFKIQKVGSMGSFA